MTTPIKPTKKDVDDWLNDVDYNFLNDGGYVPSEFALNFTNFIKLVNGEKGESNLTPVVHLRMLDELAGAKRRLANLCHRGLGKTTLMFEYLVLYIACFGGIEGFGDITGMIYVSDSMDNGVKSARKNIEFRYNDSDFLQKYIPVAKFTDAYMEFKNISGHLLGVKMFGAKTGIRGTKIFGQRPVLCVLDDLVSDEDARSKTSMETISNTIHKGVTPALDPNRQKIIFNGTPFNKNDVLYEAVESGAWYVNVWPVCERFPCTREEFRGSWEDRFSYDFVLDQYESAMMSGKLDAFQQEFMLRITSDEERLVQESEIVYYDRKSLLRNKGNFNFYITTDFATSEKTSADYSVISVWAYSANGDWYWVDGICTRQLMDKNVDDLFRLVQEYMPQSVGVEVTGQQGGFIQWIRNEMMNRNIWMNLASEGNRNAPGIRPTTNKMQRFHTVLPLIKAGKILWPEEMKDTPILQEFLTELRMATLKGFKSKHDDCIDTISMLMSLKTFKPSGAATVRQTDTRWDEDDDYDFNSIDSYVV